MTNELNLNYIIFSVVFSVHYIKHFYSGSGYSPHMALVPRWPVTASFITVAFVMAVSEVSDRIQNILVDRKSLFDLKIKDKICILV